MQAFPNARIYEAYGWTEGGWVTSEIKQRGTIVPHSVGWSAFGSEVVVLDDLGNVCAPGVVGEVAARTPVHFSHYLNNPEATTKGVGRTLPEERRCRHVPGGWPAQIARPPP